MKWLLRIVAVLALLLVAGAGAGFLIGREHIASSRASYQQTPEAIWGVITDEGRLHP